MASPPSISSDSSDEKVTSSDDTSPSETPDGAIIIDDTLPAKYAETLRMHSRLSSANDPSMSSRVLLLGFLGLLFYFAIRSKWELRLIKAQLFPREEYDEDYTGLLAEG